MESETETGTLIQEQIQGQGQIQGQTEETKTRLVDIEVTDQNVALNLIVSFINLAQRRGAFSLDESSKIWDCVKRFQKS